MSDSVLRNGQTDLASFEHKGLSGRSAGRLRNASDDELVSACRAGERAAFDVLLKRHKSKIDNMAYRLCGDSIDAQDIAANAYVRIYQGLPTLNRSVTLTAWIRRIVLNVYYDWQRQRGARRTTFFADINDPAWEDFLDELVSDDTSVHSQLESKERQRILGQVITKLPDHHRRLMILFHVQDRSYVEISQAMNLPVGTVKSRLNRARLAVRRRLSPHLDLFEMSP